MRVPAGKANGTTNPTDLPSVGSKMPHGGDVEKFKTDYVRCIEPVWIDTGTCSSGNGGRGGGDGSINTTILGTDPFPFPTRFDPFLATDVKPHKMSTVRRSFSA